MKYSYIPRKLVEAKASIVSEHQDSDWVDDPYSDEELIRLLGKILMLEPEKVDMYAMTLSGNDMKRIAAYIPHNYYGYDLTNIIQVFRVRANTNLYHVLYDQWQESFENKSCNAFLKELTETNDGFQKDILDPYGIDKEEYIEALSGVFIPLYVGRIVFDEIIDQEEERLKTWGIKTDSRLSAEIEDILYVICDKETYLNKPDEEMVDIAKKYFNIRGHNLQKDLLVNLLEKLSIRELEKYPKLGELYRRKTGDRKTEGFNQYFRGVKDDLVQKYINWINILRINEAFGYDERSEFWKQFRFLGVKKCQKSNSLLMETNEYFISEFLETEKNKYGPMYFIEKEYFENKHLRVSYVNDSRSELKSYLYNLNNKEHDNNKIRREIHTPPNGWQDKISWLIINYGITTKI